MTATLTATFDSVLSRVKLAAAGLNASTNTSILVRWDNGEPQTAPNAFTVRGGNVGAHTTGSISDYEFIPNVANAYQLTTFNSSGTLLDTVTASITPAQTVAFLKDVTRPSNNLAPTILDASAVTYTARSSTFDVLNRALPIAITDLQGGRSFSLSVRTTGVQDASDLAELLSNGAILYLQIPDSTTLPATGYFTVGNVSWDLPSSAAHNTGAKVWTIPLIETAAPDPSIIGFTSTWADIVTNFTSWTSGGLTPLNSTFGTWTAVTQYVAP